MLRYGYYYIFTTPLDPSIFLRLDQHWSLVWERITDNNFHFSRCDVPEEPEDEDEVLNRATYQKVERKNKG